MEIIRRKKGMDIWRGKDAEGRIRYAATRPREDGTRMEPIAVTHTSQRAALEVALSSYESIIREVPGNRYIPPVYR